MKRIFTYVFCALMAFGVTAQVTFEATVSKTTASTADRLELSFTLSNGGKASGFKPPSFADFKILGGPNQSNSYSSINGKTTQSFSYKYVLQAKTTGTFTIGSASIQAGGKTYTTRPISITITQKSAAEKEEEQDLTAFLRNNFYLRAEVSDAEIYKGEEIFVTYYLYVNSKSDIMDFRVNGATKVPAFDGFYAEEIDVSHIQGEYKNINGQQFLVQPVKKVRLTAQRPGDLLANPLTIDATVSVRNKKRNSGDPFFDDFFGRGYERYNATATSPAVKIKVKDLPSNAPDSFNGAVGSFDMTTSINTTETATDEPLTYRIELRGKGNITLFNAPELALPPGWETYEPKVSGGKDSRTYEYLLIPRNPGTFELPVHEWSYFDPQEQQYFTLSSDAYQIVVSEGKNYKGSQSGPGKEEVEQLAKDIQFITRDEPRIGKTRGIPVQSPLFAIGMSTPFVAGLFLIFFTARKRKQFDPQLERNKQAGAIAKKRLQVAGELVAANNTTAFYNEGIRVMWGYLGDKFNIPPGMLNKEHIAEVLQQKGVHGDIVSTTLSLLQQLEMGLYAPALAGVGLQAQYHQLEDWIMQIEKQV